MRSQFGGDFDVFPVERGQPVAVGTAELFFLPEHHVVVGRTDDLGGRRVERHVRPTERATGRAAVRPAAAHARRPRRSRRFRAHGAVAVCNARE